MGNGPDVYELISLGPPASGWRAAYSGGGAGQVPLLLWGVFRKTRRDANGDLMEDLGTVMEGITASRQPGGAPVREFSCAAESEDFEGYLPPT